jgi:uncharacterized protein
MTLAPPFVIAADDLAAATFGQVESNCACPDSGVESTVVNLPCSNLTLYQKPVLYTDALAEDLSLVFSPLGRHGVCVLNQSALTLLRIFDQPRTLAEGVRFAGDPPEGLATVRRMAALQLLTPIEAPSPHPVAAATTLTAWLHVTNDCNLRCTYCYVAKTPDPMLVETGRKAVDAIFRSAVVNGFRRVKLKYAGGEATLNFPLVLTVHAYAQQQAMQHGLLLDGVVLSNGVALGYRQINELKAAGLRLMISLDGLGDDQDRQRPLVNGRGSFRQVIRTLDRLAGQEVIPSISITVSHGNLNGLPQLVAYVLQRQLPFTLNFFRDNDCAVAVNDLTFSEAEMIAGLKAAFAVIEAHLPPYRLLDRLVDLASFAAPHQHTCGVGHSYLVVDQDGGIAKCHMAIERTITDIYAADPLQLIRADETGIQNPSVEEKEGCRDCTWRYWCSGGCPALTYRATGRFDIKSPNCNIYKAIYPELLRLEAKRLVKYGLTPSFPSGL